MIKRIFYTIQQAIQHRGELLQVVNGINCSKRDVLEVKVSDLVGVKVLAVDFDGVLASHGKPFPNKLAATWLKDLEKTFNGSIVILSNKPSVQRKQYFLVNFPKVEFINALRKKPYPDGLQYIEQKYKVKHTEVLLIDDRLLTGVLAAIINKNRFFYIKQPYTDFQYKPVVESFFYLLRVIERFWFRS